MPIANTKLAKIIFSKKIDYEAFYMCFIVENMSYSFYEENYNLFGEQLTAEEFYTLRKVGLKGMKTA